MEGTQTQNNSGVGREEMSATGTSSAQQPTGDKPKFIINGKGVSEAEYLKAAKESESFDPALVDPSYRPKLIIPGYGQKK